MAWAEAVERLGPRSAEEQRRALRDLASSHVPEVACWAIDALNRERSVDMTKFLLSLPDRPHSSVLYQNFLDLLLLDRCREEWEKTPRRFLMLQSWVTRTPLRFDAEFAVKQLAYRSQSTIPAKFAARLLTTAALSAAYPREARLLAVKGLHTIGVRPSALDIAVEELTSIIRAAEEDFVALQACEELSVISPFELNVRSDRAAPTPDALAALRGLAKSHSSAKVRQALTRLLDPATPPK
jgi:hypothetical protein